MGTCHSWRGDFQQAIRCYNKAIELNPKDHHAWRDKGVSLSKQSKEDEAIRCYDKAIELNPGDHHAWREKGASLSKQGKEDEAIRCYDKAIELNSKDHRAWCNKGFSFSQQGKKDEAIRCYRKAIELSPKDHRAWREKGASLSQQGKEDEAIRCYDKAIELNPGDHHAWRNKGASLSKQGKEDEAIRCYDKAIELNPGDHHAWRQKGVSLSKQGKEDEAIRCCDKAIKLNSGDHRAWREKGVSFSKQGKEDEAICCYRKAIEINPEDHLAWGGQGASLLRQRKTDEALEAINKALKINEKEYGLYTLLAGALYTAGKVVEASEAIKSARRIAPEDKDAKEVEDFINKAMALEGGTTKASHPTTPPSVPAIRAVVDVVRKTMENEIGAFQESMAATKQAITDFLSSSRLKKNHSLLFVLRKWNSYTPSIPRGTEDRSVGGGYFIHHNGVGTVIDPGYNFIENFAAAGGRIEDIDNVILTHAHNDHTIDFESILTLVYKYNDDKKFRPDDNEYKRITVYANTGALFKFSGMIDLRGARHIRDVQTLIPGHSYTLAPGLQLRALPAYHDEVIATHYAVGLHFIVGPEDAPKNLVFTSDTGLFPQCKQGNKTLADTEGKEIWQEYGLDDKATLNLLVPHLGSLRATEFDATLNSKSNEVFYPNHLGAIGTARLVSALRPKLAIVSEFGEELRGIQESIMKLLLEIVEKVFQGTGYESPTLLPGDLPLIYDIQEESIYCVLCKKMSPIAAMRASCQDERQFYYYCKDCNDGKDKISERSKIFHDAQKHKTLFYFKKKEE